MKRLVSTMTLAALVAAGMTTGLRAEPAPEPLAQTEQPAPTVRPYESLVADCLVQSFELVRFCAVETDGKEGDGLKGLAGEFQGLVRDFKAGLANVKAAPPAPPGVPRPSLLPALEQLDSQFSQAGRAMKQGDRRALLQNLVAARYALERLGEQLPGLAAPQPEDQPGSPVAAREPSPPRSERPAPRRDHFNQLTCLVLNKARHTVEFVGVNDPRGPNRGLPYEQMLAAALRLPEESGTPGEVGSVPGFSLEPTGDVQAQMATVMSRLNDQAGLKREVQAWVASKAEDMAYWNEFCAPFMAVIRTSVKNVLHERKSGRDYEARVERATKMSDIFDVMKDMAGAGALTQQNAMALGEAIQHQLSRCSMKRGYVARLPEGVFEQIVHADIRSKPTFFGIEPDTQLARVVFESDCSLKSLAGPEGQQLKRTLPYHQSLFDWILSRNGNDPRHARMPVSVIQIVPGTIVLEGSRDRSVVQFGGCRLRIAVRNRTTGGQSTPDEQAYAAFLSGHYDDYARAIAPLWEIREVYKIIAAARYLKSDLQGWDGPALDTSWSAPGSIRAYWDAGSVGMGDTALCLATFCGGVDLGVQKHVEVRNLSDERARVFLHPEPLPSTTAPRPRAPMETIAGRANGYPIASTPDRLAGLDYSDAKANIRAMTPQQRKELNTELSRRTAELVPAIDHSKQQEFAAVLKAQEEPHYETWIGLVKEKVAEGTTNVREIGEQVKHIADGTTWRKVEDVVGVRKGKEVGAAEVIRLMTERKWDQHDIEQALARLGSDAPSRKVQLTLALLACAKDSLDAYREYNQGNGGWDGTVRALPHAGKALKDLYNTGDLAKLARAAGGDATATAGYAAGARVYGAVAEVALRLSLQALDMRIVNEGVKHQQEMNQLASMHASNKRSLQEAKLANYTRLQALVRETGAQ